MDEKTVAAGPHKIELEAGGNSAVELGAGGEISARERPDERRVHPGTAPGVARRLLRNDGRE